MAETAAGTDGDSWSTFWHEVPIAAVMGLATLASGWSSYQSALWEGIQTFRLTAMHAIGRNVAVKDVEIGQQHVLDSVLLERFLDAREDGDSRRAAFFLSRLSPELRPATQGWLDTRPMENPSAVFSPFRMKGYAPAGAAELAELRRKQTEAFDAANEANKISDSYVRITVFFGLSMFLAGISAVLKATWPRRSLIAGSVVVLAFASALLMRLPLAAE